MKMPKMVRLEILRKFKSDQVTKIIAVILIFFM